MQDYVVEKSQWVYNGNVKWGIVISQCLIFAILPPIIGLPWVINSILNKTNSKKTDYYKFFACLALFLGFINSTKIASGDQINYAWAYLNVPEQGLIGSMKNIYGYSVAMGSSTGVANISVEFMNGIYNFIGYYITFSSYAFFECIITFTDYFLIFVGLYKFAQTLQRPHIPIVCGVLILSFFYLYFNFTLQIQKQFLAQSIMMYVLGEYALTGKMTSRLWCITGLSLLTHTSMILFVPFLFFKKLQGAMNRNNLILLSGFVVFAVVFAPRIAGSIGRDEMSIIGEGIDKIARQDEVKDGADGQLDLTKWIIIMLPMIFVLYKKLWKERKSLNSNVFILNIVLLLILAIFAMFNMQVARYRYFMMLYAFMPFVYPFFSNKINSRDNILKGLSFVMIFWFVFQFEKIIWIYAAEWKIFCYPPSLLFALERYIP